MNIPSSRFDRYSGGFTLIELMIAVAIVAILVATALPSYQAYVLRSHRTIAITALLDLGSRETRYYTANNAYTTSLTALGYGSDPVPLPDALNPYYSMSVSAGSSAGTLVIQAAPVANQTSDTCGTFSFTDLGVKSVSAGTVKDCWKF